MSHASRSSWRIFAWPAAIGVLGGAGLFAALLGDGAWDALAWGPRRTRRAQRARALRPITGYRSGPCPGP